MFTLPTILVANPLDPVYPIPIDPVYPITVLADPTYPISPFEPV